MKAYCDSPVPIEKKKSKGKKLEQKKADLDFIDEEVGLVPEDEVKNT